MRIVRYQIYNHPPEMGWIKDNFIGTIEGGLFEGFKRGEPKIPLQGVDLLPPLAPSDVGKIVCVGRNYAAHAKEMNNEVPKIPLIFFKPTTSLLGHKGVIRLPQQSTQVDHEGELAVVIGKAGRWIKSSEALDYIFGYTLANDVTARDLQRSDNQWTRAKGFDTFCPLGPWIDTDFDPADGLISCSVNGEVRQRASVREMIFTIRQLIVYISSIMTLEPGDLILTGTPAGVGLLQKGDEVEVSMDGLGALRNFVNEESRK